MKAKRSLSALFFVLLFIPACDKYENLLSPQEDDIIYFNSFESPVDTIGWVGVSTKDFRNEAPSGGGRQSVYVSGGCIIPHCSYTFNPGSQGNFYELQAWGKNLAIGGFLTLSLPNTGGEIWIGIQDSSWHFYQSQDSLYVPPGVDLQITMNAGGIILSAILVDLVKVIRVK